MKKRLKVGVLFYAIFLTVFVGLTVLFSGQTAQGQGKQAILFLAHLNDNSKTSNATGAMALTFKEEVQKQLGDRIRVEIFPKGQLGKDSEVVSLVQRGVIQSAIVSVAGMVDTYPFIDILNDPFRFQNLEQVYKVFDGPFGKTLASDIRRMVGLEVLGYGDTGGLFVLTNSKHPIRHPRDLKGLRIRTMGVESHMRFLEAFGATPVPIPWGELYSALGTGIADGQMNPASLVSLAKFDRVQTYLTTSYHIYTPYIWLVNPDFYASLTATEQEALRRAARKAVIASRELAKRNDENMRELAKSMKIIHLTGHQLEEFQNVARGKMSVFFHRKYGPHGDQLLSAYRADAP